jgi:tRNA (cmo5U34)-methyltransferase
MVGMRGKVFKSDNATPHLSAQYDDQVRKTIPYYDSFHDETIKLVKTLDRKPEIWLDTGCGTGSLIQKAAEVFPRTSFILADPSGEMIDEARKKLSDYPESRITFLDPTPTQDLIRRNVGKPDVITAIQSHHYLSREDRKRATKTCHKLLKQNGLYVTFENIRPFSKRGAEIGLEYWGNYQRSMGRDAETVEKHMSRFDVEYFPITVEEHISLYGKCGFKTVELLWYSYMQAGFYCIK